MNSARKSISSGSRRRLFDISSEDTDHVIFENIEKEIEGDDAGFQDLNEYVREQHGLVDDEIEDTKHIMFGNNQNRIELGSDSEDESKNEIVERVEEQTDSPDLQKKAERKEVQQRCMAFNTNLMQRETIEVKNFGQPIGPVNEERDTVGQFSRFLGTIARNASYAPLTYSSWPKVPDKEMM
ncbi:hypothetical protein Tco_0847819 [Tanacetum coccineum]